MNGYLQRLNVSNRIWILVTICIASILTGAVADVLIVRQLLWQEKKASTRQLVESAYSVMLFYHKLQQEGQMTEAVARKNAIESIRAMRYNVTEYFWINDTTSPFPRMIMHPTMPALEGKVMDSEIFNRATAVGVGKDGPLVATDRLRNLFAAFVEATGMDDEGYVTYEWPKHLPDGKTTETTFPKLSFVKRFAPWGWIVGSGLYIDDLDQAVHKEIMRNLLLAVGVGLTLSLIAFVLARSVTRSLQRTVNAMSDIAEHNHDLVSQLPVQGNNEIAQLAKAFNDMVKRIQVRDVELARHRQHLEEEVVHRTLELQESNSLLNKELIERRKFSEALKQANEAIVIGDPDLRFVYVNPAFTRLFEYSVTEVVGQPISILAPIPGASSVLPAETTRIAREQGHFEGQLLRRSKSGRDVPVLVTVSPVLGDVGQVICYVATMADLTELKKAEAAASQRLEELTQANDELHELNVKLVEAQTQLLQSEKLASIGQLAAGVAHEINNPIGFVNSNLGTLGGYVNDVLSILEAYEKIEPAVTEPLLQEVHNLKVQVDIAFLRTDALAVITESLDGLDRVKKIVKDLKDFSRVEQEIEWKLDDLHAGLESTLNMVRNELKYKCEVRKAYGDLPQVECLLPQLNQVFMNLLVNAAQSIDEHGVITIHTGTGQDGVWVEITDTGCGISEKNLTKIFDPFFTTKPIGKGTGLGLSVSHGIIHNHRGRIHVESMVGVGTTFHIWLPIKRSQVS